MRSMILILFFSFVTGSTYLIADIVRAVSADDYTRVEGYLDGLQKKILSTIGMFLILG